MVSSSFVMVMLVAILGTVCAAGVEMGDTARVHISPQWNDRK